MHRPIVSPASLSHNRTLEQVIARTGSVSVELLGNVGISGHRSTKVAVARELKGASSSGAPWLAAGAAACQRDHAAFRRAEDRHVGTLPGDP